MTTRNGKIARLPFDIREQINHRLLDNDPAKEIVTWLNTDSTVRVCLERLFEGRSITEQNISEWRQGGFEEWLAYRSCLENISDLSEKAARVALTDVNAEHLLTIITAAYADLLHKWDTTPEIPFNRRLIVLQNLTTTALSMRRGEQRDAQLKLDRDRLEILRQRLREKSSSSSSSKSRFLGGRAIVSHPHHPKAPEIRRPPIPEPETDGMTDQEWLETPPAYRPNASGPCPRPWSSAAFGPSPNAIPSDSREPDTKASSHSRPPNPSTMPPNPASRIQSE